MQECGRCRMRKPLGEFSPSYRGKPGTWCKACFSLYNRLRARGIKPNPSEPPKEKRVCTWCRATYTPRQQRPSEFCSRQCKISARNARESQEREAAKPARSCVWCGAEMPQSMRSDAKFCSAACNDKAHAVTRKAARRAGLKNRNGDLISLAYIADRDGWRCGLCGGKVAKDKVWPDPLAASLDHILPIARGGSPDDPANLHLTHLRCNLEKRDQPRGEQMRLVG